MKVYITYDRYEDDEWFYVYQFTNDLNEVKRDYKDNLKHFIEYGPDDCHSYQIQVLNMTKSEYLHTKKVLEDSNFGENEVEVSDEFIDFMTQTFDDCRWCHYSDTNCLLCTDGCSDLIDMTDFWIEKNGLDPNDEDDIRDKLIDDEVFYNKVFDEYFDEVYKIF